MYQDDDFGAGGDARRARPALKDIGMALAEKTTYKRGATDFSSQIAKMKGAGCDLVVLGTIIRETSAPSAPRASSAGTWNSSAPRRPTPTLIHKLGGPAMNGFYATNTVNTPYLDDASKNVRDWVQRYKEKFKEDPTVFSVYGYQVIDLFIQVADKTGPNLTTDSFVNALDSFTVPRDMFGADAMSFTQDQAPRLEPRAPVADPVTASGRRSPTTSPTRNRGQSSISQTAPSRRRFLCGVMRPAPCSSSAPATSSAA